MKELYEKYKRLLFTLAYQLTGSATDAEDAVQDVFMKLHELNPKHFEQPKAYLCKMVTNRCLDLLRSARKQREQYFGPWLPEPILTSGDESLEAVVRSELLSYAMLVLLERLSPAERAVFVLREALRFDFPEIARLVNKSEVNCRKLLSRARGKMGISEEEKVRSESAGEEWVRRFVAELEEGNVDKVLSLLAEDVTLVADGGGKAIAGVHPIHSRDHVARFLFGILRKTTHAEQGMQIELTSLNGQTGIVVRLGNTIDTIVLLNMENGVVKNLYFVRNPDKMNLTADRIV